MKTPRNLHAVPLLLLIVMLFLSGTGCVSYQSRWETAGRFPDTGDILDGRWEGQWLSDRNGHNGRIRCIMHKTGDTTYLASFQAKYWKLFTFHYDAVFETAVRGTNVTFSGEANLGWWAGGVYRYAGQADGQRFFSTYTNRYDFGTFRMQRQ